MVLAAACAGPEREVAQPPVAPPQPVAIAPVADVASMAEEAKALLAQAETDVQRARARRALWLKAWEDLLAARQAVAAKEHPVAIRHAKRASELAQLGLEQLAYPAVK
ncbi:MAG: hypothetical protein H7Y14_09565 [Burkholderiales bacterium]|nr:hypothetical protein [Burkholderiales bacterium]